MPSGIPELKKRNSARRARYHARANWKVYAESLKKGVVKHLERFDLLTGETQTVNRSAMEDEIRFVLKFSFETLNPYSYPPSVVWTELERGAALYTKQAIFRLVAATQESCQRPEIKQVHRLQETCLMVSGELLR